MPRVVKPIIAIHCPLGFAVKPGDYLIIVDEKHVETVSPKLYDSIFANMMSREPVSIPEVRPRPAYIAPVPPPPPVVTKVYDSTAPAPTKEPTSPPWPQYISPETTAIDLGQPNNSPDSSHWKRPLPVVSPTPDKGDLLTPIEEDPAAMILRNLNRRKGANIVSTKGHYGRFTMVVDGVPHMLGGRPVRLLNAMVRLRDSDFPWDEAHIRAAVLSEEDRVAISQTFKTLLERGALGFEDGMYWMTPLGKLFQQTHGTTAAKQDRIST